MGGREGRRACLGLEDVRCAEEGEAGADAQLALVAEGVRVLRQAEGTDGQGNTER